MELAAHFIKNYFRARCRLGQPPPILGPPLFGVCHQIRSLIRQRYPALASIKPSIRAVAKKLDRDLRRDLFDCLSNFVGGLCQSVRVDVDTDTTVGACHMRIGLESADGLLELPATVRALKFDLARVHVGHDALPSNVGIPD